MSRYFFNYCSPDRTVLDDEGTELATAGVAREEAIATLVQIAVAELSNAGDHIELSMHVTGEGGLPLFAVRIDFNVDPSPRP